MNVDITFLIVMAAITYGAWKLGYRLASVGIGVASTYALAPDLADSVGDALSQAAGIGAVSDALGAGLTLLVPIVGLMVLAGWRPGRS